MTGIGLSKLKKGNRYLWMMQAANSSKTIPAPECQTRSIAPSRYNPQSSKGSRRSADLLPEQRRTYKREKPAGAFWANRLGCPIERAWI